MNSAPTNSSARAALDSQGGGGTGEYGQGLVLPSEDDSSEFHNCSGFPNKKKPTKKMTKVMISSTSSAKNNATNEKIRTKKNYNYNYYNVYFMLERQLILHSLGSDADIGTKRRDPLDVTTLSPDARRYVDLDLPPLCRRYADLSLSPHGWFVELLAGRNEKRVHRKSHGLVPFGELAKIVARNYREADQETKEFVNDVAERLASHRSQLEAAEEKEMELETRLKEAPEPGKEFSVEAREGGAIHGGVKSMGKIVNVEVRL